MISQVCRQLTLSQVESSQVPLLASRAPSLGYRARDLGPDCASLDLYAVAVGIWHRGDVVPVDIRGQVSNPRG